MRGLVNQSTLVATAHGRTLENLLLNPTLSDLVGGIESVTLSDEEARRRGTQKTVLERRAPATFDVLIEIQQRDRLAVISDNPIYEKWYVEPEDEDAFYVMAKVLLRQSIDYKRFA